MGKRGDSFARWYLALSGGKKYVVSQGLAFVTIMPVALLALVALPLLLESDDQTVNITCGDRHVERTFSKEELELKSRDPQALAVEMCTT